MSASSSTDANSEALFCKPLTAETVEYLRSEIQNTGRLAGLMPQLNALCDLAASTFAASASAATVECPECGVRFDPTWKRPTMPQQPAVVVAPTVSLTNEQTGYGYANGANAPISESVASGWKQVADVLERQVAWIDRDARHVAVVVKGREYILALPPLPNGNEEPDSKVKRIESAYCAANDYINALLNPSVPPESLAEIAADYWKKVRAV